MVDRTQPIERSIRSVIKHVWFEAVTDRAMLSAAGLAFFSLYGLLPAIAAVAAIYGLVVNVETLQAQVAALDGALPAPVLKVLAEFVTVVPRGFGFGAGLIFNLLIVIWTVQRSSSGIITALNLTHGIEEKRPTVSRQLAAAGIAMSSLAFIAVAIFLIAILPALTSLLPSPFDVIVRFGRWPISAALFLLYLWGIYRIAPAEPPRRSRWISIGSLVAVTLWLAASALFSLYVTQFGGFSSYYGSATGAVVLMTWLFLTSWVVLIGAEVNEQLVELHEGRPKDDLKERVDKA